MTERYEAEDRWRSLHPMAIEVFSTPEAPLAAGDLQTNLPIISQSGQDTAGAVLSITCLWRRD